MKVARKLFEKRKPLFEDDLQLEADRKMKAAKHKKNKAHKNKKRDEMEGYEQSEWQDDERNHDQNSDKATSIVQQ